MKILYVHYGEDWIAGSEVSLLETIAEVQRRGHEPVLWCNAPSLKRAACPLGIPIYTDAFEFYFDYSSPPFRLSAYLRLVAHAVDLVKENGIQIVHCNGGAPTQWMRPATWYMKKPLLVQIHSPYLRRSRYVLGLHLADCVAGVSRAVTAPLRDDGMAVERITVIPNGFDETKLLRGDRSNLRSMLAIPDDAALGAIVGSLIHRKGHDILFDAIANRRPGKPSLHVLVIGDGPERARLERLAEGLPVHFLGHCNDVGAVLRDAVDFLICPSRSEAFGRVIIEASLAGRPAIGSRIDGIPEAIVDGVTGLLIPPQSPSALATALGTLAADHSLRQRMGVAAHERAQTLFTLEGCVDKLLAHYQRLLAAQHHGFLSILTGLQPYLNLMRPKPKPC
jgi:L-malate glycosyltransferase